MIKSFVRSFLGRQSTAVSERASIDSLLCLHRDIKGENSANIFQRNSRVISTFQALFEQTLRSGATTLKIMTLSKKVGNFRK